MGKVRKLRAKYHLSLKKAKSANDLPNVVEEENLSDSKNKSFFTSKENIFAGINITLDDLDKSLPKDFDVRSVISTKSRKELKEEEKHLKKKERLKLRHERFMQKLDVTYQLMEKCKSKKKSQKKKAGTDMSELLDALPSLKSLASEEKSSYMKPKGKPKGILKTKHRLKQQTLDTKVFKCILNDKTFRENPLETISQYIKQKVAAES